LAHKHNLSTDISHAQRYTGTLLILLPTIRLQL